MAVVIDGVKSFEGCVVNEYEENYINDSYWYAVVWNGSEFEEILYRTTAAAGAGCATVDASEELMKKYSRHLRAKMLRQRRDDLIKIAKDVWKYDLGKKVSDFKSVELYVKPEEFRAYYVINGEVTGSFAI